MPTAKKTSDEMKKYFVSSRSCFFSSFISLRVKLFGILKCSHTTYTYLYILYHLGEKLNVANASFVRSQLIYARYSTLSLCKYVHQTEHNAIKLLFIFVFASSQPPSSPPSSTHVASKFLTPIFSHPLSFSNCWPLLLLFICFKVALVFYLRNNTSKLH